MRPRIIGLIGHARTGKDTVAKRLVEEHGFMRFAFADPLRRLVGEMGVGLSVDGAPYSKEWNDNWEFMKQRFPREVRSRLQTVGMACRKVLGKEVWLDALAANRPRGPLVIPDVRQLNEAGWIIKQGGELWNITRPGVGPVNDHEAEASIENCRDFAFQQGSPELCNSGSISLLWEIVDRVVHNRVA